jgi:formylglycine-generating enzyme required for sulfatase activity
MYSTAAGQVAQDGQNGRNSPFTEAFLRNIDKSEPLTLVLQDISADVYRATGSQSPWIAGTFRTNPRYTLGRTAPSPTPAPVQRPAADGFVRIQGGTFTMGSPKSEVGRELYHSTDETQHKVTVSGFSMGKYEVTVGEFRRFVNTAGYKTTAETSGGGYVFIGGEWQQKADANWKNPYFSQGDNHPVVMVSWLDAVRYCNWRSSQENLTPAYTINGENVSWNRSANGYRLPTEAECEYACRAGTTGPFSTGNNVTTSQANYNGNYPYNNNAKGTYRKKTTDVGSFSPNAWGLYDMHGNVWEWCWDWRGNYSMGAQIDPAGVSLGQTRVLRGGGWGNGARSQRSANRFSDLPSYGFNFYGFRLVRP